MELHEETNSSGQKEDDDASEDESDDKIEPAAHDPERLKAFNVSFKECYNLKMRGFQKILISCISILL